MKFKEDFKIVLPEVAMTTAYDIDTARATDVEMDTTICIDPDHGYGGWYETYDVATGGERFYAEGVLETRHDENGNVYLTGFDGCFELPDFILERLVEKGIINEL